MYRWFLINYGIYESRFVKFDLTKKMCNNLIIVSFMRGLLLRQSNYRRMLECGDNVCASESISGVCWLYERVWIYLSIIFPHFRASCSNCAFPFPLSPSFGNSIESREMGVTIWKRNEDGTAESNGWMNVRWIVQDWERQRREFANQSRGHSLAARFYVININYDYT